MNNSQFRRLVLENPVSDSSKRQDVEAVTAASSQRPEMTPLLGSRARSSIPMTPRSVADYNPSSDFARQVAERKREISGRAPTNKFRSSAAPKGTKLAKGYQDRTLLRRAENEGETAQDDKEKRLKALEEMFKLQQIDEPTFENLRAEIGVGGDVKSTHLVKGLDWKLLERVRQGEDVTSSPVVDDGKKREEVETDLNAELESELGKDVKAVQRAEKGKGGDMAPPPSNINEGQMMSRDHILQRLKAGRASVAPKQPSPPSEPALGGRFKRLGSGDKTEKKRFIEMVNGRRREVLLTTDKEGRTKRKVRWLYEDETKSTFSATSDTAQQPLGMEIPAEMATKQKALLEQQKIQDEDEDIFQGVGAEYDPFGDLSENSDDDSHSNYEVDRQASKSIKPEHEVETGRKEPRNYFSTNSGTDTTDERLYPTKDPTLVAAIKRAANIRQSQESASANGGALTEGVEDQDPAKLFKSKQFLENLKKRDREDAGDVDLGFGESRFGDEDDEDGPVWGDGEGEKKAGRKRGPKKRKGNKDDVSDVLGVLEGRKKLES